MIYAPKNKILLALDKLYTDELILEGGLKLYLDPSFRPNWHVTVTGTIAALPKDGIPGFEVGQKVYFSYHIVNERKWEDDRDFFVRNKEGNEFIRQYTDKKGGTINVVAFPGIITKRWGASYTNEYGEFVAGYQGDEEGVDNWLATNFKFGYSQDKKYKNLLEIDRADYWMASPDDIFAVKTEEGMKATPGYAICRPTSIDISKRVAIRKGIFIPDSTIVVKPQDRGLVHSMGECLPGLKVEAKEGDVVLFPERLVEKYEFDHEQFFVVRHRRMLAVV